MARKKLLTEGEIRQFMKLANLSPLSETYLSNNPLQEQPEEEWAEEGEEEVVEPEMAPEPPLDMGDMGDEGGEDEDLLARVVRAVADELGVEVDIEGEEEGGEEDLEDIEDIEAVDVEGGEWEGEEEEEEVVGAGDMYQEGKAGDQGRSDVANKVPKGFVNEEEDELEEEYGGSRDGGPTHARKKKTKSGKRGGASREDVKQRKGGRFDMEESINEEDIVAEVSRRVASRLMAEKQKEAAAEQLAERIFSRLTGK